MKNIFFAKFESNQRSCEVYGLWQYDYGQVLRIQGLRLPPAVEIHFSLTEKGGTSVTRVGTTKDGVTDVVIPDSLLENDDASQDYWIYAFVYLTDDDSGSTEYKIAMKVKSRPRPEAIDRPEDQELFREAIAAVNEAADRAENAVNNLNADVSEKVTRPDTGEVGQALVVKEIDESGKPTVFEAQDMVHVPEWAQKPEKPTYTAKEVGALPDDTKIPTKVSELENDSGYLTNPYDDTELKSELSTKITAPENPAVGKVFKIKSVNEDGTFIGEWADGGVANLDVQINGKSIVQDGVADIPLCTKSNTAGLIYIDKYSNDCGLYRANTATGLIRIAKATDSALTERANKYCPVVPANLDYAIKAAMCDGKGAVWTADEQAAARERVGIDEWKLVADVTLEESVIETTIDMLSGYTSFVMSYLIPKNTDDSGSNFNLWLSLYKNNAFIKDMNWFKPAVSSSFVKRGYVKIEKIANNLYDVENADFGNNTATFDSYVAYNGQFYKNNVVADIGSFDKIRVKEYGVIRFPAGTRFVIYAK